MEKLENKKKEILFWNSCYYILMVQFTALFSLHCYIRYNNECFWLSFYFIYNIIHMVQVNMNYEVFKWQMITFCNLFLTGTSNVTTNTWNISDNQMDEAKA